MSDLKLYNLKTKKLIKPKSSTPKIMQEIIEQHSDDLLGIKVITSNYKISRGTDVIPTLGYDENYNLVIIEYRSNRFGRIINKGLLLVDYIKENISEFRMLIGKINIDTAKMINYNSRLIIIGNDFISYDQYAVKQMTCQIDLIKFQSYGNNHVLLEKIYQSKPIDHTLWNYKFSSNNEERLYQLINDYVLSLGDEIIEVGVNNYLYYRKIRTFMYITFDKDIECRILTGEDYKPYIVTSEKDFEKLKAKIETSYEQN